MENLPFFAALLVLAIPFFLLGWWLMRSTQSIHRLAEVINENGVELGEMRIGRRAHGWLLFADVRFVLFLILRRYRHLELPPVVEEALDDARTDYLSNMAVFATLVVIVFGVVLYDKL
jgi:hypothetical protein